ncbi:Sodium/myo-inositol cotransporter, partial [Eschrichtius robustus]|nr:Sodium/myo-inositol cotransporter [Eschrichtius robustus]
MRAVLETADIAIVALYFILVMCIGFFAMWKSNRSTVSGYFLAGRSMTWVAIGASLFVSNIGSEHFIGLAGSGAASGFAVGAWEFNALLLLQLLGWVFIPIYIRSGVYTMPEYLSKRFGGHRIQVYFAALSLILYIFTKLSVDLYSGALFIQESLGWNLYVSVILLIGMTALLTVTGGLVAVIYTDTLQALLMIVGALTLMIISMMEIGGFEEVKRRYMLASPNVTSILLTYNLSNTNSCNVHPKKDALKMLRNPTDEDVPWPGFILGQTPASEVADYLTPPVAALFLLAIFWKRCNEQGAFYGGMAGFVLGAVRLTLAFAYRAPECDQPDNRPGFIKDIHYMYVATALFWVTGLITVIVSLLTPPPTKEQIRTTTFWSKKSLVVKESCSAKEEPYKMQEKSILRCSENSEAVNHVIPNGKSEDSIKGLQPEDVNLLVTCREEGNPVASLGHSEAETPVDAYSNGQAALMGEKERKKETEDGGRYWKFIDWFCGFKSKSLSKRSLRDLMEEEAVCLQMLEETPQVKLILNIGLFAVCSLGIFMFVYFSL